MVIQIHVFINATKQIEFDVRKRRFLSLNVTTNAMLSIFYIHLCRLYTSYISIYQIFVSTFYLIK